MESMRLVFPDRPIVEIEDKDSIFHTVYDLDDRYQILGQWALRGRMRYRSDGTVARWRGIYDDHGRIMVAMSFNSDVGRFVGVGGRSELSGEVFGAGDSDWRELCGVFDDALRRGAWGLGTRGWAEPLSSFQAAFQPLVPSPQPRLLTSQHERSRDRGCGSDASGAAGWVTQGVASRGSAGAHVAGAGAAEQAGPGAGRRCDCRMRGTGGRASFQCGAQCGAGRWISRVRAGDNRRSAVRIQSTSSAFCGAGRVGRQLRHRDCLRSGVHVARPHGIKRRGAWPAFRTARAAALPQHRVSSGRRRGDDGGALESEPHGVG